MGEQSFSTGKIFGTSIAFDSKNTPYIAYRDSGSSKVVIIKYENNTWKLVGTYVSKMRIAFNSKDVISVAYTDYSENKITVKKYYSLSNTWKPVGTNVISDDWTFSIYLAFDNKDVPHISYQDANNR